MSKKVLALSVSPRRGGNSDLLCDEFIKGTQEAGLQAEKVFLKDKKINYCTGCGTCSKTKSCSQKDDMSEILEKMVKADVIVMATPVYFYTMNGQMKTLIDRTCPRYSEIKDKEFISSLRLMTGTIKKCNGHWKNSEDLPTASTERRREA